MERKRLHRSRDERWIAGVCGGLGRYFGVDPTPIRLAFAILALWNGLGILLYLIAVLIVPEEPAHHIVTDPDIPQEHAPEDPQGRRIRILGVILLLGGVYLLMQNVELFSTAGERIIALALILAGFIILLLRPGRI